MSTAPLRTICIAIALLVPCFAHAARLAIVADPGRFASIEEAAFAERDIDWWDGDEADDRACTESFAAVELQRFLPRALGWAEDDVVLRTVDSLRWLPGDVPFIALGQTAVDELPARQFATPQSFHIHPMQLDERRGLAIRGGSRIGTLYGAYELLHRVGVRFYGLGESGTIVPDKPAELPIYLDIAVDPDYLTRGYWAWEADHGNEEFFHWMARNRTNFWAAKDPRGHLLKKLGIKLTDGGHFIHELFLNPAHEYPFSTPDFSGDKPAEPYAASPESAGDADGDGVLTYFEAHPEWFSLQDGRRSPDIKTVWGHNFCTSNADARDRMVRNMVDSLVNGDWRTVDVVNMWMLDLGQWCQCEACVADGTPTDRLMIVMHTALQAIARAREQGRLPRRVEITTAAYIETLDAPTRPLPEGFDYENFSATIFPIERCYVHAFADPECRESNAHLRRAYEGWTTDPQRHYRGDVFIGEYFNVSSIKSLPVLYMDILPADIPWYYRNGTRHFDYMHCPVELWGTWTLNQYLLAQLLWDTDLDANALINEYFARWYPTTAESARQFYEHLQDATRNIKPFKHFILMDEMGKKYHLRMRLASETDEIFPLEHLQYDARVPSIAPTIVDMMESMAKARAALDEALLLCRDEAEQQRLLEDERRFDYGEKMYAFYYHLVRTALLYRDGRHELASAEFAKVEQYAEQLRQITDLVQVASSHANARDGFAATQGQAAFDFYKERLRPAPEN